jgi:hypothetical protein
MRQIYHLGLHKTGSTSLQRFLWLNRQALARAGLLFAPVTPEAQARFEAPGPEDPATVPPLNAYMGHNALAYRLIAEALPGFGFPQVHEPMPPSELALAQVQAMAVARDCHTLLFCSEDLARTGLMAPAAPARLAAVFGVQDVRLIAAIRRPDAALAAWQTQMLRFGTPFAALRDVGPTVGLGTVHVEYRAALAPWLRAFPGAGLRLLPYTALRAQGGSVCSFAALAGCNLPAGLVPVDAANLGLPHALLEIARQGICTLPRGAAGALRRYLETVRGRLDLVPDNEIELFGPAARETLFHAFCDTNDWLSQVSGRIPFFDDLDDMRRVRQISDLAAAAAALPGLRADARQYLDHPEVLAFLDALTLPRSN